MSDELDTFMSALQTKWAGVSGIKMAPEHPLEGVPEFPTVVSYFAGGRFSYGPATIGVHRVHSDVLLSRSSLPYDEAAARPFILRWLAAIAGDVTLGGACDHCILQDYEMGGITYNEQQKFFGVRFINEVKIHHSGVTVAA